MAVTGAATTRAAAQAATPNSVNDAVADPTAERYPGAVDATQYGPGSSAAPGGPAGPVAGDSAGVEPFTSTLPVQAPGGGYQDAAWTTGHDGPQVPWDSSAGAPFAPSGAVDPDLHGLDTGGVFIRQHVIPAAIGKLTRRTMPGQTTIKMSGDQVTRDNQTSPNGRVDLDQQQWHDPDGYDPWEIPYGERPILNNLAYQPVASTDPGTAYGVAGGLPDRSPYDYPAQVYDAPPDPSVLPASAGASPSGIGGGWV